MADITCEQSLIKQRNMAPFKCFDIKLYYLASDATGNKTESELGEKKKEKHNKCCPLSPRGLNEASPHLHDPACLAIEIN